MGIIFKKINTNIEKIDFQSRVVEYFGTKHKERNINKLRKKRNFISQYNLFFNNDNIGCFSVYMLENNGEKCLLIGPIIIFKNFQKKGYLKEMLDFVENKFKDKCDCYIIVGMENIYSKYGYTKCENVYIFDGVEPYEILWKNHTNCVLKGEFKII